MWHTGQWRNDIRFRWQSGPRYIKVTVGLGRVNIYAHRDRVIPRETNTAAWLAPTYTSMFHSAFSGKNLAGSVVLAEVCPTECHSSLFAWLFSAKSVLCSSFELLCPVQRALSDDAVWRLSVWRLSRTSGRRAACAAGRMARIGWSCPARPVWLKTTAARFRCRRGRGHIVAAARLQPVKISA